MLDLYVIWTLLWCHISSFKPLCYLVLFCAIPQTSSDTIDYSISFLFSYQEIHSLPNFLLAD